MVARPGLAVTATWLRSDIAVLRGLPEGLRAPRSVPNNFSMQGFQLVFLLIVEFLICEATG